jgi:uncharacterized membrane protein
MARQIAKAGRGKLPHPLFILFLALLAISVAASACFVAPDRAFLLGFDLGASVFALATWLAMRGASAERLRADAARNDAGRALLLLVASILLLVVLIVVGVEVARSDGTDVAQLALVVGTLILAWLFGNLVYALHYVHLFYDPGTGGADHEGLIFPGTQRPLFPDFCYFAFVLGMTFQVSDVQIASPRIRRTATVHGLVAFFFNIGIVALTVSVVAGAI